MPKCVNCKKIVSTVADECQHCGEPDPRPSALSEFLDAVGKLIIWAAVLFFGFALITDLFGMR